MPELPEVEVTRENLERWLRGRTIVKARVLDRRILGDLEPARLERTLEGARVRAIGRRGKCLIWDLGARGALVSHLGMTGKFVARKEGEEDPQAARVVLDLSRGRRVVYADPRLFGRFFLGEDARARISELGVEPLSRELDPKRFGDLLHGARVPIKLFLLDQARLAGLGNIQAAEALFRAGIHPARSADGLSAEEARALWKSIRATLTATIRRARGPEITYLEERDAENTFLVYGREGSRCPRCRTPIERLTQAGRSSFFCPRCQPPERRRSGSRPRAPDSPAARGARRARRASRRPRRR